MAGKHTLWGLVRLILMGLAATVAIAYLGAIGFLYVDQRPMLYGNRHDLEAPAIHGLAVHTTPENARRRKSSGVV